MDHVNEIKRAAVIGTGMMGPGIASTLAGTGIDVVIVSRSEAGARKGEEQARGLLAFRYIPEDQAGGTVSGSNNLDQAVRDVDLVIESAPEEMDFKQTLFEHLDRLSRPDTILASNTSGLSITAIASRCQHPERVLTTHFWNPPNLMPLVEVVKGEKTDSGIAEEIVELLRKAGKTPVLIHKDRPGQLGNRLQMALLREACYIVQEGIATVEDVDLAARTGFGLRLPVYGIFEHQDAVGLDLGISVLDYVARDLCSEPGAPAIYRDHVAAGELGAKSGKGFYDWSKRSMDEVKRRRNEFVRDFLERFGAR